jgi:hypothetical protein
MAVKVLDMGCAAVGRYLESNAFGFRSRMRLTATSLTAALSGLFSQDRQRQDELQVARAAKHWQYLQYRDRNGRIREKGKYCKQLKCRSLTVLGIWTFDSCKYLACSHPVQYFEYPGGPAQQGTEKRGMGLSTK